MVALPWGHLLDPGPYSFDATIERQVNSGDRLPQSSTVVLRAPSIGLFRRPALGLEDGGRLLGGRLADERGERNLLHSRSLPDPAIHFLWQPE